MAKPELVLIGGGVYVPCAFPEEGKNSERRLCDFTSRVLPEGTLVVGMSPDGVRDALAWPKEGPPCPFKVGDWVQPKDRAEWGGAPRNVRCIHITRIEHGVIAGFDQDGDPASRLVEAVEPYAPEPGDKVVLTLKDGQEIRGTWRCIDTWARLYVAHQRIDMDASLVTSIEPDTGGDDATTV